MSKYFSNVLIAFDRYVNAIAGGDPEMTVSGRMGRAIGEGRCKLCSVVCHIIDLFAYGHCAKQATREAGEGSDEVIRL